MCSYYITDGNDKVSKVSCADGEILVNCQCEDNNTCDGAHVRILSLFSFLSLHSKNAKKSDGISIKIVKHTS